MFGNRIARRTLGGRTAFGDVFGKKKSQEQSFHERKKSCLFLFLDLFHSHGGWGLLKSRLQSREGKRAVPLPPYWNIFTQCPKARSAKTLCVPLSPGPTANPSPTSSSPLAHPFGFAGNTPLTTALHHCTTPSVLGHTAHRLCSASMPTAAGYLADWPPPRLARYGCSMRCTRNILSLLQIPM